MVSAGDFRNGITFEMDGNVYSIIEFQHVKPGKGAAFVRTKIRNVITGSVVEKTFNPNDKYPTAFIDRKDMQYLYNDAAKCSTSIAMGICIISWIWSLMSSCQSTKACWATTLNL